MKMDANEWKRSILLLDFPSPSPDLLCILAGTWKNRGSNYCFILFSRLQYQPDSYWEVPARYWKPSYLHASSLHQVTSLGKFSFMFPLPPSRQTYGGFAVFYWPRLMNIGKPLPLFTFREGTKVVASCSIFSSGWCHKPSVAFRFSTI